MTGKTFNELDEKYKFVRDEAGQIKFFIGDEPQLRTAFSLNIWSLTDCPGEGCIVQAGIWRVNNMNYLLSEERFEDGQQGHLQGDF